jgi:hypothetical protein
MGDHLSVVGKVCNFFLFLWSAVAYIVLRLFSNYSMVKLATTLPDRALVLRLLASMLKVAGSRLSAGMVDASLWAGDFGERM